MVKEDKCSSSRREGKFILPLPFCSFQALNRLDGAGSHWRGSSSLLSLFIQTLISSGNTFRDTPRNNVLPALWA